MTKIIICVLIFIIGVNFRFGCRFVVIVILLPTTDNRMRILDYKGHINYIKWRKKYEKIKKRRSRIFDRCVLYGNDVHDSICRYRYYSGRRVWLVEG